MVRLIFAAFSCALALSPNVSAAKPKEQTESVYLKCVADGQPYDRVGADDVYIDFKAKTFTNPAFNTVSEFKEIGGNLVSEERRTVQGEAVTISTLTINQHTLRFTYTAAALGVGKSGQCQKQQSQME